MDIILKEISNLKENLISNVDNEKGMETPIDTATMLEILDLVKRVYLMNKKVNL